MTNARLAGAVLLMLAAMGVNGCTATEDSTSLNEGDKPTQAAEEESAPKAAKTDGDYDLACAYEIGGGTADDPFAGYSFTGGGTLTDTGNTNIRVRVTYQWKRLGSDPKTVKKTYRVKAGEERDVNVTVKATQPDISAHQNAEAVCKATAKIVGTY